MLKFIAGFGVGAAIGMVLAQRSGINISGTKGEVKGLPSVEDHRGEVVHHAGAAGHQMASESAPDIDDSRDELGLPTIDAVRL